MKQLGSFLAVFCLLLTACAFSPSEMDGVSAEARAVLETVMTAPNEELIFRSSYTLSFSPTEEERAAAQEETDRVEQAWEQAVGKYLSDGAVDTGLEQRWLNAFQLRSRDFKRKFAIKALSLVDSDETAETVDVVYTADGEEHKIRVYLEKGSDGKITSMTYSLAENADSVPNILLQLLGGLEEPDAVGQSTQAELELAAIRQSLLVENDAVWVALSADSTAQGSGEIKMASIVVVIYTQDGEFVQEISYGARLSSDCTLINIVRSPADYLTLEDVNSDGADDLRVITDNLQAEGNWSYRVFLWDEEAGQFVAEN